LIRPAFDDSDAPLKGLFIIWRSGFLTAGCGRKAAVLEMGLRPIFCLCTTFTFTQSLKIGFPMASKQTQLEVLLEPVVEAMECELWGLDYVQQGRQSVLRLYIEKEGGVLVEDCERVSRQVSATLDVEDPIPGEYTLEVSSPGMDRPLFTLEHFERYVGEKVAIRLRVAFEGRRKFSGLLKGVEDDEIVLEVDNEEYLLPFELVDKANVVPSF
jgi:ribosome maturation factor RimP